ncbi:hypothetical protein GACE_0573 [Geoglobus acetivorans]|uniref:DUF2150 domain-containing protein n=2 Tax=Geoglobus acetivorans TaxID=565033 RepID=A0A0A7GC55_GEOAI|nr:hypothetical protein GACE_0573 [Geoglobus acetivorans]
MFLMFYSEERLANWLERINSEKIDIETGEGIDVFDRMLEDYIIACRNLMRSIRAREITKKEAIALINESEKVLEQSFDFGDELKGELFEITKEQMKIVLEALKLVIEGKVSKKSFDKLLNEAFKKEHEGDIEGAFESVVKIAAKVLAGEEFPEDIEIPDEDLIVVGWLDAVDAINTINVLSEIDKSEIEDDVE